MIITKIIFFYKKFVRNCTQGNVEDMSVLELIAKNIVKENTCGFRKKARDISMNCSHYVSWMKNLVYKWLDGLLIDFEKAYDKAFRVDLYNVDGRVQFIIGLE